MPFTVYSFAVGPCQVFNCSLVIPVGTLLAGWFPSNALYRTLYFGDRANSSSRIGLPPSFGVSFSLSISSFRLVIVVSVIGLSFYCFAFVLWVLIILMSLNWHYRTLNYTNIYSILRAADRRAFFRFMPGESPVLPCPCFSCPRL